MMIRGGFGKQLGLGRIEPPIELRFVDLFMIIVAALMFVTVILSIISAFLGDAPVDEAPRILTRTMPKALTNEPYVLSLAAEGGTGSYTWHIVDGHPPDGVNLDGYGRIAGTPTRVQQTRFLVKLIDSRHNVDSVSLVMTVDAKGEVGTPDTMGINVTGPTVLLPEAAGRHAYHTQLSVRGGLPPYHWRVTEGRLPTGLLLSPEAGTVSGTPTEWSVLRRFKAEVTDASGRSAIQAFQLKISSPPTRLWWRIIKWGLIGLVSLPFVVMFLGSVYVVLKLALVGQRETTVRQRAVPGIWPWIKKRFGGRR